MTVPVWAGASVTIRVLPLYSDAKLIGLSKAKVYHHVKAKLVTAGIHVRDGEATVPELVVRLSTVDAGSGKYVTYCRFMHQELAKLNSNGMVKVVSSWSEGKMVAGVVTEHENQIRGCINSLLDSYIKRASALQDESAASQ